VCGHGWDKTSVPSTLCDGPLRNDDELSDAVGVCVAVIDVWPWMESHAVRRVHRPVVSVRDRSEASLLKAVRATIEQRGKSQVTVNATACSMTQVLSLLQ